MRCSCCEEEFEEPSEGTESATGQWYCEDCYDDIHTTCTHCGCEVVTSDSFSDGDDYYCEDCEESQFFTCSDCGDRKHLDDATLLPSGDRICDGCRIGNYSFCGCCDNWVHDTDWCSDCETCEDCCRCDYCGSCGEHNDNCTCNWCDDCDEHNDDCTCEEHESVCPPPIAPPHVSPFRDSGGNPVALIERLDNSKFELLPDNVTKVLGMLDKDGTLNSRELLGRPCTGDSGYYRIGDIICEVGKVAVPKYIYGVRSNEYDIVISSALQNDAIESKLRSLGLSYTYASSVKEKVGLSFKVRKRKYRKCITFLKFYCNI